MAWLEGARASREDGDPAAGSAEERRLRGRLAETLRLWESVRGEARSDFFNTGTFTSWMAVSTFLVSFGVLINNTNRQGEPKAATAMAGLGFILTVWASSVFFSSNWAAQHRPALIALLAIVVVFLLITVWLVLRIWIRF
jgi:lipopolysaccharide export LptBFGC system permease protein LptF